jgi:hypothetical protein
VSGSSLLCLIAKKVVLTASASTEAEHIHSATTFERARHRVLRNHISFSSLLHQEPAQLSSSSFERRFPSWNPLPGINCTRLSLLSPNEYPPSMIHARNISADTTQAILTHRVLFEFVITSTQHRHLYIFLQVQFLTGKGC